MSAASIFRIAGGLALAGAVHGASAAEFVNLHLRVTANGHALIGAQRFHAPQTLPSPATPADRQLKWQLLDGEGQVLSQGAVSDPRILRGPLDPGKGHAIVVLPSAGYMLRVPVDARAADLRLLPLTRVTSAVESGRAKALESQGEAAGVPAQRIDISAVMKTTR